MEYGAGAEWIWYANGSAMFFFCIMVIFLSYFVMKVIEINFWCSFIGGYTRTDALKGRGIHFFLFMFLFHHIFILFFFIPSCFYSIIFLFMFLFHHVLFMFLFHHVFIQVFIPSCFYSGFYSIIFFYSCFLLHHVFYSIMFLFHHVFIPSCFLFHHVFIPSCFSLYISPTLEHGVLNF